MRYGLNLLLWTVRMHEGMEPIVARVKEMGSDGVEMPMFELNESLYTDWGKRLDDLGLDAVRFVDVHGAIIAWLEHLLTQLRHEFLATGDRDRLRQRGHRGGRGPGGR